MTQLILCDRQQAAGKISSACSRFTATGSRSRWNAPTPGLRRHPALRGGGGRDQRSSLARLSTTLRSSVCRRRACPSPPPPVTLDLRPARGSQAGHVPAAAGLHFWPLRRDVPAASRVVAAAAPFQSRSVRFGMGSRAGVDADVSDATRRARLTRVGLVTGPAEVPNPGPDRPHPCRIAPPSRSGRPRAPGPSSPARLCPRKTHRPRLLRPHPARRLGRP